MATQQGLGGWPSRLTQRLARPKGQGRGPPKRKDPVTESQPDSKDKLATPTTCFGKTPPKGERGAQGHQAMTPSDVHVQVSDHRPPPKKKGAHQK